MDDIISHSYAAPAALVAHCRRAITRTSEVIIGSRDAGDIASLINWLNAKDEFSTHDAWVNLGMAIKLEFGDAGLDLWRLSHDSTVTESVEMSKWDSFATDPKPGCVTIASIMKRGHALGWKGNIRTSTNAMFSEVAQLAAASGATLHGGMPMNGGQAELTRLAKARLEEFLVATPAVSPSDISLPLVLADHGLYSLLNETIARVLSLLGKRGNARKIVFPLAALYVTHEEVFRAVADRAVSLGHPLDLKKIKLAALNLTEEVQRITVTLDKWEYDPKSGRIENDNPDNLQILLGMLGLEIRFNAWLERIEVQGSSDADFLYPEWTYLNDVFVTKLVTRAKRSKTRFCLAKEFCWDTLIAFAHKNTVDPALEHLASLQAAWDGTSRLATWLHQTAATPDDAYHAAVARVIIGGMVRRIRQPGSKHDMMPVFFGKQGTGKSTIAKIIADMGQSSLAEIDKRSAAWFADEILLGDASKELVLSLAGKCLVEISEMGQRNSANIDHIKAMLSKQVDRGRTAYARAPSERPRRNIFFGTVNGDTPLQDTTGNRRFLPVAVSDRLDLAWLSKNIRQLIGEACVLEAKGETFQLPPEVWATAEDHQEAARSVSDIEMRLRDWFAETEFTREAFVSTRDLMDLADWSGWRNIHAFRNEVLKKLGFKEIRTATVRGWLRGSGKMAEATRYAVSKSADGQPRVTLRASAGLPALPY